MGSDLRKPGSGKWGSQTGKGRKSRENVIKPATAADKGGSVPLETSGEQPAARNGMEIKHVAWSGQSPLYGVAGGSEEGRPL